AAGLRLRGKRRAGERGEGGELLERVHLVGAFVIRGRHGSGTAAASHRGFHVGVFSRSRSLKRWILPVAVLGSSAMNSISGGYLYGASLSFTKAFSSASVAAAPGLSTTNALVLVRPSASGLPIIAASSTAGCCISVASTSKGDTNMPLTFTMSSLRPA